MIKNLKLENSVATGNIELSYKNRIEHVDIIFDDESNNIENVLQIQPIIYKLEKFFKDFDIDKLLLMIAKEVNEACYEQSDYQPKESDNIELANNLQIVNIYAYLTDMVITFYSPLFLPDMNISCQIIYRNKKVENLEIYDK
ncbi:hypothetical protein [Neisseria animaloris]|uniref:hypothetical protein n=1 Tax=Neisseria animaloris TaxID=326522 RepID=UPI000D3D8C36|nr:hypothetical protein [Neisseria animaloris]